MNSLLACHRKIHTKVKSVIHITTCYSVLGELFVYVRNAKTKENEQTGKIKMIANLCHIDPGHLV